MLSIETRFNTLDGFLQQWQWLWREVPFKQPSLTWFDRHPEWKTIVDALDYAQLQQLAGDIDSLYTFARQQLHMDIASDCYRVDESTAVMATPDDAPPDGISQRKWRQICAFGNALQQTRAGATQDRVVFPEIIEWCAGKGHLSRRLLQQQLCDSAVGLEYDTTLIDRGSAAVRKDNIALQLKQQNVLDDSVAQYCQAWSHHIALHACGKLHINMLRHCSDAQVSSIDLVPCCYHLIDEAIYRPLSQHARRSALTIDQEALKLALQETVTAPANARRGRERLQRWRLGFDALQRQLRGIDNYLPVPSVANSTFANFRDFCRHCATLKQIDVPADIDLGYFEAIGSQRFDEVSRYDLIRQLFRRPIELWLALDRCLFLAERGYQVTLSEFCDRAVTPRNLWIHASHRN